MEYRDWFRWFAIAMVVILGLSAAVFTRAVDATSETLEQVMRYDVAWSGALGRIEAAQLERRVVQLALTDDRASLDAANVFYQILLGRFGTWGSGDFRRFLDRHPDMSARFDSLSSDAEALGGHLQELAGERSAADPSGRAALVASAVDRAGEIRKTVDRLAMGAHTLSVEELARVRADLHGKQTIQKVLLLCLLIAGIGLFAVTTWQKRSLVRANAAIAGGAQKLAESEERLSGVLANTTDGVMVLDTEWRITFANQKAIDMLFPDCPYLGARIWDLRRSDQTRTFYKHYRKAMMHQTAVEFEAYLASLDSWLEVHAYPTRDNLTVFFRDVTERRRLHAELMHLTRHDPLTDLANRTLFAERLASGLDADSRNSDLTLVLIDLDDFKAVNDQRGHQSGDDLLQQIARRLSSLVREEDTVARLGGDEFAIIQPGPAGADRGAGIARRISEALLTPFDIQGARVSVGTSIGIAIAPDHGTRTEDLVHDADVALYRAKGAKGTGLNFCVFEPGMEDPFQTRQEARLELQRTSADELNLHIAHITTALDHMSQGLCMFDADNKLIVCNERYGLIYGVPPEVTRPGTHVRDILQSRLDSGQVKLGDPDDYVRERLAAIGECRELAEVHHLVDGRVIALSHRPLQGGGWVATHDDITDLRRIETKMVHMAHHDDLTCLPNRMQFRDELNRALGRNEGLAVLCIDLDKFKSVNDALGHPIGDGLLCQVAERLRKVTRGNNLVARLGGDEFAILLVDIDDAEQAKTLAQCTIQSLGQPYEVDGHQVVIAASVGIAGAPTDSADADQLLKMANMALYRCKQEGRGVYRFFEPEMDARAQARRSLELDLRKALAGNELELHYQPIVDIRANRVSGFEALLRWHHAERGNVSPGEFVPLAEEVGLIGQLGAWVLKEACAEAATWPSDVRLAVNLSPAQFAERELVLDVLAALGHSGLAADRLELEITETVMLQDTGPTLATLHCLRDLGVHVALDDFGTGYSSLSFVRKFPFDRLKIDRSFIENVTDDGGSLGIVRAVLALADSVGMSTTAEGVETVEQLARLNAEGCPEVQGFVFSPARPASDIAGLLTSVAVRSRRLDLQPPSGHERRLPGSARVRLVGAS